MNARELLAAATPRPWTLVDDDPESCPYIVPSAADPVATIYDIDPGANAHLIVRAVNEYEALLAIADAAQSLILGVRPGVTYRDLLASELAKLDEVRNG